MSPGCSLSIMNYFHVRATCNGATLAKLLNLTIFCNRTGKLKIHFQSTFLVFHSSKGNQNDFDIPNSNREKRWVCCSIVIFQLPFQGKMVVGCSWSLSLDSKSLSSEHALIFIMVIIPKKMETLTILIEMRKKSSSNDIH